MADSAPDGYELLVDACHARGLAYPEVYVKAISGRVDAKRVGFRWYVSAAEADRLAMKLRAERESIGGAA
jgi:hypothetical protein